jgi:hypothetical protein
VIQLIIGDRLIGTGKMEEFRENRENIPLPIQDNIRMYEFDKTNFRNTLRNEPYDRRNR